MFNNNLYLKKSVSLKYLRNGTAEHDSKLHTHYRNEQSELFPAPAGKKGEILAFVILPTVNCTCETSSFSRRTKYRCRSKYLTKEGKCLNYYL